MMEPRRVNRALVYSGISIMIYNLDITQYKNSTCGNGQTKGHMLYEETRVIWR